MTILRTVYHLYAYDTAQDLGVATPEQVAASDDAARNYGGTGVILIDSGGDPISGSWDAQQPGVRSVYTDTYGARTGTLYDTADVAAMLGVKPATVRRYRATDRTGPPFPVPIQTLGGRPGWTREQVEAWARTRPGKGAKPRNA